MMGPACWLGSICLVGPHYSVPLLLYTTMLNPSRIVSVKALIRCPKISSSAEHMGRMVDCAALVVMLV